MPGCEEIREKWEPVVVTSEVDRQMDETENRFQVDG